MTRARPTIFSLALLALALGAPAPAAASRDTTWVSTGLARPVRIVTDRWGIPHLRAENLSDLYFAWGYVTARDRLWELEFTRRAAEGQRWRWARRPRRPRHATPPG